MNLTFDEAIANEYKIKFDSVEEFEDFMVRYGKSYTWDGYDNCQVIQGWFNRAMKNIHFFIMERYMYDPNYKCKICAHWGKEYYDVHKHELIHYDQFKEVEFSVDKWMELMAI